MRYPNDESALYGDFAEASDAGKMGDIDEIPPGKGEVNFVLRLSNEPDVHPREEQLKVGGGGGAWCEGNGGEPGNREGPAGD